MFDLLDPSIFMAGVMVGIALATAVISIKLRNR